MVSTQSWIAIPEDIMVLMIFEVRVERMLAFTPLPNPSARTVVMVSSW